MPAKKRIWSSLFYTYFQKHYCPNCGARLDVIKVSRVVNSKSEEAINFDFRNVDNYLVGDVEFTWDEFRCNNCGYQLSIKEKRKVDKSFNKRL